jgi:hypothetical protein
VGDIDKLDKFDEMVEAFNIIKINNMDKLENHTWMKLNHIIKIENVDEITTTKCGCSSLVLVH